RHTCARVQGGKVLCWGTGSHGQLGDRGSARAPGPVPGVDGAKALAAGQGHTCAITSSGVTCWGASFGKRPVEVAGVAGAVALTAGDGHTCARTGDGGARCWGDNAVGQLGDGTTEDRKSAVAVAGLQQAVSLAAGADHTCAALRDGGVVCWGSNEAGALGNGVEGEETVGVAVSVRNLTGVSEIASGDAFTCALSGGQVLCWGAGNMGQLGDGSQVDRASADDVDGLDDA